ncbi:FAD-binding protein [Actinotignum urinale]|uniref:FAD-binding protein n=1 Tax=Actinotignum urinale TaxID=190146 RepID=UPI0003B3B7E1|nr:FAD-binding protein [Actinotignum urinale]MDY5159885.1 FAD-binding protein [Actinotignum urinale]
MAVAVAYKITGDPRFARFTLEGKIEWSNSRMLIGDDDVVALQAGRNLADKLQTSLIGLNVGTLRTSTPALRKNALSKGPDSLMVLADEEAGEWNGVSTAQALARMIRRNGEINIVLTGSGSNDEGSRIIPSLVGGHLGWPVFQEVSDIDCDGEDLLLTQHIERETRVIRMRPPVVVAVTSDAAAVRIPRMNDVLSAAKKPVDMLTVSDMEDFHPSIIRPKRTQRILEKPREHKIYEGIFGVAPLVDYLDAQGVLPRQNTEDMQEVCFEREPENGSTTWFVCMRPPSVKILNHLRRRGKVVVIMYDEGEVKGADEVIRLHLPENCPAESSADTLNDVIRPEPGDIVLFSAHPTMRALAGAVATRQSRPIFCDVRQIKKNTLSVGRFGGRLYETYSLDGVVVGVQGNMAEHMMPPLTEPYVGDVASVLERDVDVHSPYVMHIEKRKPLKETDLVLRRASRVVAAGRGCLAEGKMELFNELAHVLKAVRGITRPLSEGEHSMPRSMSIGLSAAIISPDLYIAVGISGDYYHVAGIRDSRIIVAINSDPNADIFDVCDVGIVGDVSEILPVLTQSLRNRLSA